MSVLGRIASQARIAGSVLVSFLTAPYVFVYPILGFVILFGGIVGTIGGVLYAIWRTGSPELSVVVLVLAPIVTGLLFAVVVTAYCYEVDVLLRGKRPVPLSGLVAAIRKLPKILVVAIVGMVGTFLTTRSHRVPGPIGSILGTTSYQALQVAYTFAIPIVALTDGSFRDTFGQFQEALSEQWGAAVVTTVGFRTVSRLVFNLCWWPALALGAVNALAYVDPDLSAAGSVAGYADAAASYAIFAEPLGPATVPLALLAVGFAVPIAIQVTLGPPIKTILTRYALDGELPAGLRADVNDLVEVDDEDDEAEPEPAAPGAPA